MQGSYQNTFDVDRRSGTDRRNHSGINIRSLLIGGRRTNIRRQDDKRKILLVDRYSTRLFAAIIVILSLSITDALLTLMLIDNGAYEMNPVMAYYLNGGPHIFIVMKYLLTCLAIFVLLMYRNVFLRTIRIFTHSLFYYIIGAFMAVVAWELYLFRNVNNLF